MSDPRSTPPLCHGDGPEAPLESLLWDDPELALIYADQHAWMEAHPCVCKTEAEEAVCARRCSGPRYTPPGSLFSALRRPTTKGACDMTVGRYDDNTWAVYDAEGKVLAYGFFGSQDAYDWIEAA